MKITGLVFGSFSVGLLAFAVSVAQDTTPPPDTSGTQSSAQQAGTKPAGLPNPASVNCEKKGGKLKIRKGKKGEYGVCKFPNGKECEEWALFRGKCSPTRRTLRRQPPGPTKRIKTPDCVKSAKNAHESAWRQVRNEKRGLLLPANVGERLCCHIPAPNRSFHGGRPAGCSPIPC